MLGNAFIITNFVKLSTVIMMYIILLTLFEKGTSYLIVPKDMASESTAQGINCANSSQLLL